MDIVKAAENTLVHVSEALGRDASGKSIAHAVWMLAGISLGYIQDEKAHRWLGYAQGLLVVHGVLGLPEVKKANHQE